MLSLLKKKKRKKRFENELLVYSLKYVRAYIILTSNLKKGSKVILVPIYTNRDLHLFYIHKE